MIYYGRSRETQAQQGLAIRILDGTPLSSRYVKNHGWAKREALNVDSHPAQPSSIRQQNIHT
jgi:hypothetical protein